MKEALSSNEVTETNYADVFKKHLGGAARNLIDNSLKTLADVKATLLARYGSPQNIWNGSLEKFKKKCNNNSKAWASRGKLCKVQHYRKACCLQRADSWSIYAGSA